MKGIKSTNKKLFNRPVLLGVTDTDGVPLKLRVPVLLEVCVTEDVLVWVGVGLQPRL